VLSVVKSVVAHAMQQEAWTGAQLLRLHFHDCFVNVWLTWSRDFLKFTFGTISCVYVFGRCWMCSCCSQITQIYQLSMTAEWCSRNSDNAVFECYWCS
jgi:hypothetical protein